jgi:hypothetical protein
MTRQKGGGGGSRPVSPDWPREYCYILPPRSAPYPYSLDGSQR